MNNNSKQNYKRWDTMTAYGKAQKRVIGLAADDDVNPHDKKRCHCKVSSGIAFY